MSDLLRPPPPKPSALAAARAAMLQEAARPRTSWKAGVTRLVGASLGLAVLVALVGLGAGASEWTTLVAHGLTLLGLAVSGPLLAWSAARPGSAWLRRGAWGLASLSGLALVLLRPADVLSTSSTPEWVCSASHLAVAVPAAVVALLLLRSMAFDLSRAVAAGLCVGTTGALLGELFCGRSAGHVALFHLGAWALAATVVVLLSRTLSRRSFAP